MSKTFLAILGRQPEISLAELEAQFLKVKKISDRLAIFQAEEVDIDRLGGSLKIARELEEKPLQVLQKMPEGKITLGVSDYSKRASKKTASGEALKLKKILSRQGRSVRVVLGQGAELSTATSLHNGLGSGKERKIEFLKVGEKWFRVVGVQDIEAYRRRDQARPARDARVGMLPPKLAQILINLCGVLEPETKLLDPFCGTGVVLQEAMLKGLKAYGTDISERMIDYSRKNLERYGFSGFTLAVGDATNYKWQGEIGAVACEGYLGRPMSKIPTEMKLKAEKQECGAIMMGFLKNLAGQISPGTPVVVAMPAWLREDGSYSRLLTLDLLEGLGYNIDNKSREGLIYHRMGQIVARDIIILRKK